MQKPIQLYGADNKPIQSFGAGIVSSAKRKHGVPYTPPANKDWSDLMPDLDHGNLMSTSRSLYENNGNVRGSIDFIASRAVGRGYTPRFGGKEKSWGEQASDFLRTFYKIGNVKGQNFDFKKTLILDSISISRDGDAFCLLTKSKSGYPMLQSIPAHRIGTRTFKNAPKNTVMVGRYRGMQILNGCIISKLGRVIAYCVLGDDKDGKQDRYISARDLISLADYKSYDQHRGLPCFSFALDTLKQLLTSNEYELHAQLIMSSLALQVHNEDGEPSPEDFYGEATSDTGVSLQSMQGGSISYFEAGSGSKIETLTNDRPSANWQSYHARLIGDVLTGINMPASVIIEARGNGTATRMDIGKAEATIQTRQDLLDGFALRKITYALAVAIDQGMLPPNKDWAKWEFSHPKKLSIDLGRDSKAQIEEYRCGLKTKSQILLEQNIDPETQVRENVMDEIREIKIREEMEKLHGVTIDPRHIRLLTPNETLQKNDK